MGVMTLAVGVMNQIGMVALGFGSLFFCALLYLDRIVPCYLATWGFVGYAVFFAGAALEISGRRFGVMLSISGRFFEIAFGIVLIAKGFGNSRAAVWPDPSLNRSASRENGAHRP